MLRMPLTPLLNLLMSDLAKAVRKALRLDTGDGVDLLKIPKHNW